MKGTIYYVEVIIELTHKKEVLKKTVEVLITGYDWADAMKRAYHLETLERTLWPQRRAGLKGTLTGLRQIKLIHESGKTVHDIEPHA